ncbi:pantoate--beta-alanine ligase [Buchananella felis]|uniref:pantoate--beta-alanine ligase n=1 Tax=Buchananella felis TaxID=3231492 RepID=UPI0035270DBD
MKILARTRAELADALSRLEGRRGVVMTMGAIHEGHLDLVRAAAKVCDHLVATVFVNPLQFGPSEDLDAYPRDLEGDFAKLTGAGAAVVFAPSVAEMYPHGAPTTTIQPGSAGAPLEGARRPGHFAGVCTVVIKLLGLTRPDVAAFGRKDAQQLAVIGQLVEDLDLPVEILPVPIRREEDGLAMSSRNAYLSEVERQQALALSASLRLAQQAAARGEQADDVAAAARSFLQVAPGVELEYAELVDPKSFEPFPADGAGAALLVLAARVGTTRLIDNAEIEVLAR